MILTWNHFREIVYECSFTSWGLFQLRKLQNNKIEVVFYQEGKKEELGHVDCSFRCLKQLKGDFCTCRSSYLYTAVTCWVWSEKRILWKHQGQILAETYPINWSYPVLSQSWLATFVIMPISHRDYYTLLLGCDITDGLFKKIFSFAIS